MTGRISQHQNVVLAALVDAAIVVVFVLVGRRTHQQGNDLLATLGALWPFLLALTVGWWVSGARRAPTHVGRAVVIWGVTISLGMVLRAVVMGHGTATAFVLVAAGFTAAGIIGWRLIASRLRACS
jgi:hypothetical protein